MTMACRACSMLQRLRNTPHIRNTQLLWQPTYKTYQSRSARYLSSNDGQDSWRIDTGGSLATSNQVRQAFVGYFQEEHGHVVVPSSSVVPHNDNTLNFANAGMNQFKDIFQGTVDPRSSASQYRRVTNSQKCIRSGGKHNDLEDVGRDLYHHTFFEMLGNWSFGDYFKEEACSMAWDLLTRIYGLPKDRLYVTYFGGNRDLNLEPDFECKEIWGKLGVPSERILPFGMEDNFWEMGNTGPCGPCSEIHYDRTGNRDATPLVNRNDPDVIELWNLVFMQYDREPDGSLKKLPKRHVDTGMGLERLVSVLQGVRSNYDTDLFQPIIHAIQEGSGARPYTGLVGEEDVDHIDTSYRILADHARMLTVAISDGERPYNSARGSILKRVIRRAVRYSSEKLGAPPGLVASLVPVVVQSLGEAYPNLTKNPQQIMDVINDEEDRFTRTLIQGNRYLRKRLAKIGTSRVLPGNVAFQLEHKYGFPLDLITIVAEEKGLTIDTQEFNKLRKDAIAEMVRGRGKDEQTGLCLTTNDLDRLSKDNIVDTDDSMKHNCCTVNDRGVYEFKPTDAKVLVLKTDSGFTDQVSPGDSCLVILDRTNFYAEQGGQEWDEGHFMVGNDEVFHVTAVQQFGRYVAHFGVAVDAFHVGTNVKIQINGERREKLMRNHTATHILNFALRSVLGESTEQRGSLVAADRLRFDFSAEKALTKTQLRQVSDIASDIIGNNSIVYRADAPYNQAKGIAGLRALFDDVYQDKKVVNVVSIGNTVESLLTRDIEGASGVDSSVELCGGTHVVQTGHIKRLLITSQTQKSGGVRQITAITGDEAIATESVASILEKDLEKLKDKILVHLNQGTTTTTTSRSPMLKEQLDIMGHHIEDEAVVMEIWRKNDIRDEILDLKEKLKKVNVMLATKRLNQISSDLYKAIKVEKSSWDEGIVRYVAENNLTAKELKKIARNVQTKLGGKVPIMLLSSIDEHIYCACLVPEELCGDNGIDARQWVDQVTAEFNSHSKIAESFSRSVCYGQKENIPNAVENVRTFISMKMCSGNTSEDH